MKNFFVFLKNYKLSVIIIEKGGLIPKKTIKVHIFEIFKNIVLF